MHERNIRLDIEYDGTVFSGWQIQNGQPTIQGALQEAIKKTTGQQVNLIGAGRTDAGVHALGQVANFRIEHALESERFADALNYYLPDAIRVTHSTEVPHEFHARFDAIARRYRYMVATKRSALYRHQRHFHRGGLDLARLKEAAKVVVGDHDFAPFCVVASRQENNHCQIFSSTWRQIGPLFIYEIRGNRFLHSMVRSLVGCMLNLATESTDENPGNLTMELFTNIIRSDEKERMTFTAPACGLYLVAVGYRTKDCAS